MQISAVIGMESTPRSKHIKRWGRGEIDNASATSWMSDEASLTSQNSPLKAGVHFKTWTVGWTKNRTNIKWAKTERGKKRNNIQQNAWTDKLSKNDVSVTFINEADIFLLLRNTYLVYTQSVNPGDPIVALQIKWKILRPPGLLSRLLYAARHDLAMAAILSEGRLALLVAIYYLLH